jgi:hypothetical protein
MDGTDANDGLVVVEKVCKSATRCRRYRVRALALRNCPAIGLAALASF